MNGSSAGMPPCRGDPAAVVHANGDGAGRTAVTHGAQGPVLPSNEGPAYSANGSALVRPVSLELIQRPRDWATRPPRR